MPTLRTAAAAALLIVYAASAQAYTLACQMTDLDESGGYIPRAVSLTVDETARTVRLRGPEAVLATLDGTDGTISVASDSRVEASIETVTRSASNQRARMLFRLTWIKRTNRASIAAIPLGYANRFLARGACARQ